MNALHNLQAFSKLAESKPNWSLSESQRTLKKFLLIICVFVMLAVLLSGLSFNALNRLDKLAKASDAHYNVWQEISRHLDYALRRYSNNILTPKMTLSAKARIVELMDKEQKLNTSFKQQVRFNLFSRLILGASVDDIEFIKQATVPAKVYQNIRQSQNAPVDVFQLGYSQWDVPSLVSFRSGTAFNPLEQRALRLESFIRRGYSIGPWVLMTLSLVVLSLVWLIWLRGISPILQNLHRALEEKEYQKNVSMNANSELLSTQYRLRTTLEHLPAMVVNMDMNFKFTSVNTLFLAEFGFSNSAEVVGKTVAEIVGDEIFGEVRGYIERCYQGESQDFVQILDLTSGRKRLNTHYAPLHDEKGKIYGVLCLKVDVDKHYQTEKSLRQSEEYIRIALNSIGDAVIATDENGIIQQFNLVAQKLTGWSEQSAFGQYISTVVRIYDADTMLELENPVLNVLRSATESTLINQLSLHSKQGDEYSITHTASPILDASGNVRGCVLTFRDISKEFERRLQLIQLEKMRAIGILSGGISHDFNNLLAGISSSAEMLMLKCDDKLSSVELTLLENIIRTTERGADLATKLTTFSQSREYVFRPIDINSLIENVLGIFRRTTRRDIVVAIQKMEFSTLVLGDESSLHSAFFNILINAGLAMPTGGRLSVGLKRISLDGNYCDELAFDLEPGEFVEITIRDTGVGMSDEVMERIFEPFYTTREQGKGAGLGLSSTYGTIVEHNGAILVDSELQKGTVFRVLLPISEVNDIPRPALVKSRERSLSRTVLLIDDEKSLIDTLSVFVESLGHKVLVAYDGKMGVEKFANYAENIDLVIIDMNMPVMDGANAIKSMRALSSSCKYIGISGHASENFQSNENQLGADAVLLKPFRFNALEECIASVLS